jgi:hypothetical protein
MSENKKGNFDWVLPTVCWILSAYFFVIFHVSSGFPPTDLSKKSSLSLLLLSLFLFLLPFAKRIKLGKIFEFEREINEIKNNVNDFKNETRQNISLITSSINTISNLSNTVYVNIPGREELEDAKEKVKEVPTTSTDNEIKEIKEQLALEDEDTILALARTRILIEQTLRKILGKRLVSTGLENRDLTFLSARSLFQQFVKENKAHGPLRKPLDYVLKVCNAAIHGQRVSPSEAEEALDMGAKIIAILNDVTEGKLQKDG